MDGDRQKYDAFVDAILVIQQGLARLMTAAAEKQRDAILRQHLQTTESGLARLATSIREGVAGEINGMPGDVGQWLVQLQETAKDAVRGGRKLMYESFRGDQDYLVTMSEMSESFDLLREELHSAEAAAQGQQTNP